MTSYPVDHVIYIPTDVDDWFETSPKPRPRDPIGPHPFDRYTTTEGHRTYACGHKGCGNSEQNPIHYV